SLSGINGKLRPGIVHRIDMDTSGVIVAAKNDTAHQCLAEQLEKHSMKRIYIAIVEKNVKDDEGTIDKPIGRHPTDRKKMAITDKNSKRAVTHYKVIERLVKFTVVRFMLETGRTHQIRVHFASIGHPLVGDTVYGSKKNTYGAKGQALHAKVLGFIHPRTKEYMEFESPLPEHFIKLAEKLKKLR
ncbi:MAG: RluA family pseudouridine synthase, partial [Firmicutes bacterium]|nr:RluA family pseudouridine synthase [Bacillota bacterium]